MMRPEPPCVEFGGLVAWAMPAFESIAIRLKAPNVGSHMMGRGVLKCARCSNVVCFAEAGQTITFPWEPLLGWIVFSPTSPIWHAVVLCPKCRSDRTNLAERVFGEPGLTFHG